MITTLNEWRMHEKTYIVTHPDRLYHFTSFYNLLSIAADGMMMCSYGYRDHNDKTIPGFYISTTTDGHYHKKGFTTGADVDMVDNETGKRILSGIGGAIVFDRAKLEKKFKLREYDAYHDPDEPHDESCMESELLVMVNKKQFDIRPYIMGFTMTGRNKYSRDCADKLIKMGYKII